MSLLKAGAKSLVGHAAGWASGLNWYKLGAELVLLLSLAGGCFAYGVHHCEIKHEHQQAVAAKRETKALVQQVQNRVPQVQKLDHASNQKREQVKATGDKLHESLAKSGPAVGCNFTDEQLQLFRELAQATHR